MRSFSTSAKLFIGLVVLCGLGLFGKEMFLWRHPDTVHFLSAMLIAALAARMRVSLPGITGSMSVNLPFILLAMIELSLGEAMAIACISSLVQCMFPESGKRNPVQMVFNVSSMAISVWVAGIGFRSVSHPISFGIAIAVAAFLLANTLPVAAIISMTEAKNVAQVWQQILRLTFPYYVLSAGIATIIKTADVYVGWQVPVTVLPVMALIYHSYTAYFREVAAVRVVEEVRPMAASAAYD